MLIYLYNVLGVSFSSGSDFLVKCKEKEDKSDLQVTRLEKKSQRYHTYQNLIGFNPATYLIYRFKAPLVSFIGLRYNLCCL